MVRRLLVMRFLSSEEKNQTGWICKFISNNKMIIKRACDTDSLPLMNLNLITPKKTGAP